MPAADTKAGAVPTQRTGDGGGAPSGSGAAGNRPVSYTHLLGTIILGVITVEQGQDAQRVNERLSEENNKLQKIMTQKLLPVVKMINPSCKPTMIHRGALSYAPQAKQFRILRSYYGDSVQHEINEIRVNIDS